MKSERYLALDALRGICAMLVCLFHFRANNPLTEAAFVRGSWQFVDLFFVISGFVMAASYGSRLHQGMPIARFAMLRLARLYPLHLAVLAVFVAFEVVAAVGNLHGGRELFNAKHSVGAIVTNLLFLQSFGLHDNLTWNEPAWSIAVEFWTCVAFAVGVRLFGFRSWWIAAVVGISILTLATVASRGITSAYDFGIFRCFYGFGVGAICWRAMRRAPVIPDDARHFWTVIEAAMLTIVGVFISNGGGLVAPLIFAPVVLIFAAGRGAISDALTCRPLMFLGTISYSVYLLHSFIQARFDDVLRFAGCDAGIVVDGIRMIGRNPWEGALLTLIMLIVVIVASAIAHAAIEMRVQAAVKRALKLSGSYTNLAPPLFRQGPRMAAARVRRSFLPADRCEKTLASAPGPSLKREGGRNNHAS